jgi:hypothetical protein
MSYYQRKKSELQELLLLIKKEKEDFIQYVSRERHAITDIARLEKRTIDDSTRDMQNMKADYEAYKQEAEKVLSTLVREKTKGFPWVVKAYTDYWRLQDEKKARHMEEKSRPALKAAEHIRQLSKERHEAEKAARLDEYLLEYCRFLAPWLDEYIGMDAEELDTIINDIHLSWEKKEEAFDEEVKRQTGPRKWEALTPTERLQRKLDWYWGKPRKTNWQIGRDYERYIGYLYEQNGWNVYYHGKKGYEDLGRDLVCKKGKSVEIIQCKYWSKERTIHEKHVYYLYGTTVEYFLETFGDEANLKQLPLFPDLVRMRNVVPKLVVTTEVSPKATQVAKVLGIIIETIPFQRYPSVKCNVSRKNGEKIFHLPFDQQYDTILIEEERLERYVEAVNEAESLGFRHAYRWKGETPE